MQEEFLATMERDPIVRILVPFLRENMQEEYAVICFLDQFSTAIISVL